MKIRSLKWQNNNDPLAYGLIASASTVCSQIEIYAEDDFYAVVFDGFPEHDKNNCTTIAEAKQYAQDKHGEIIEKTVLKFLEV